LERLRQIKRIQSKVTKLENGGEPVTAGHGASGGSQMTAAAAAAASPPKMQMSDFTEYTFVQQFEETTTSKLCS